MIIFPVISILKYIPYIRLFILTKKMSKLKQVLKQVQCISFNGGWTHIKAEGIDELVSILTEGFDTADTSKLKAKQMELYTTCYKMCK